MRNIQHIILIAFFFHRQQVYGELIDFLLLEFPKGWLIQISGELSSESWLSDREKLIHLASNSLDDTLNYPAYVKEKKKCPKMS